MAAGAKREDVFRAGATAIGDPDAYQPWDSLVRLLPPKHYVQISGPWGDGHVSVRVVDASKYTATVVAAKADSLAKAIVSAHDKLSVRLGLERVAAVSNTATRPRVKGRFVKAEPVEQTPSEPTQTPGFTRDRDLVAYLVYKNGRVSQYELRHQYGIKNPAQAINDAESHFQFSMRTGDKLPNGDIPYRLVTSAPEIAGTLPMFASGVEDPDEKLYVLELDLYLCVDCGRHPVYRPQRIEGKYAGVCPRHGPMTFTRV